MAGMIPSDRVADQCTILQVEHAMTEWFDPSTPYVVSSNKKACLVDRPGDGEPSHYRQEPLHAAPQCSASTLNIAQLHSGLKHSLTRHQV